MHANSCTTATLQTQPTAQQLAERRIRALADLLEEAIKSSPPPKTQGAATYGARTSPTQAHTR